MSHNIVWSGPILLYTYQQGLDKSVFKKLKKTGQVWLRKSLKILKQLG